MSQVGIRETLGTLGERRRTLNEEQSQLRDQIRMAVGWAVEEEVSITEAAELLGLNRSTIYDFYRGETAPA